MKKFFNKKKSQKNFAKKNYFAVFFLQKLFW